MCTCINPTNNTGENPNPVAMLGAMLGAILLRLLGPPIALITSLHLFTSSGSQWLRIFTSSLVTEISTHTYTCSLQYVLFCEWNILPNSTPVHL